MTRVRLWAFARTLAYTLSAVIAAFCGGHVRVGEAGAGEGGPHPPAAASGHSLALPLPGRLAYEPDPRLTPLLLPTLLGASEPEGTEAGFRQVQAAPSPGAQARVAGFDT